ncbi:hypothetical protein ABIA35_008742 [Catenulispora sp. MAP12-49]|uniref:DUF6059 family protein n=1 Tax=Catenulispora sp. MAP12-49 TaxID=3156302 RepID=UPI00351925DF
MRPVVRRRLEAVGKAMLAGLTAYAWYWSPATRTRRREPQQTPEKRPEPVAEPSAGPPPGHPERMPRRTRLSRVERALFRQLERTGRDG